MDHDWVRPLALNIALFAIMGATLAYVAAVKTRCSIELAIGIFTVVPVAFFTWAFLFA